MATDLKTLVLLLKGMRAEQSSLHIHLGKRHYAIKIDSSLINPYKYLWMKTHICRSLCILLLFLYMFLFIVYCLMHAYDRSLVNITSLIPCLVSINSSSDDLIESVCYMLIHMQHISVLRIFTSLGVNFWYSYIYKVPCLDTKSRKLSLQMFRTPLAL